MLHVGVLLPDTVLILTACTVCTLCIPELSSPVRSVVPLVGTGCHQLQDILHWGTGWSALLGHGKLHGANSSASKEMIPKHFNPRVPAATVKQRAGTRQLHVTDFTFPTLQLLDINHHPSSIPRPLPALWKKQHCCGWVPAMRVVVGWMCASSATLGQTEQAEGQGGREERKGKKGTVYQALKRKLNIFRLFW